MRGARSHLAAVSFVLLGSLAFPGCQRSTNRALSQGGVSYELVPGRPSLVTHVPRHWRVSAGSAELLVADDPGSPRAALGPLRFGRTYAHPAPGLSPWHVRLLRLSQQPPRPLLLRPRTAKLVSDGNAEPFVEVRAEGEGDPVVVQLELRARLLPTQGRGSDVAAFEVLTRVTNTGESPLANLAWEDRMVWPGPALWVPNVGTVSASRSERVSWFGRQGTWFYVMGFPDGARRTSFGFDPHGPWDQIARGDAFELAPGQTRVERRLLFVSEDAMAPLISAFLRLKQEVQPLRGSVEPAPARGEVHLATAQGAPLAVVPLDAEGRFFIDVPPGSYLLTLKSTAGAHTQFVEVRAGMGAEVAIAMPPAGFVKVTVKDESGRIIPARLRFDGLGGTPTPTLGLGDSQAQAANFVYALSSTDVQIPAGRYRVTATHGPEFSSQTMAIVVEADAGTSVTAQLARAIDVGAWVGADLHVHAMGSFDSTVPIVDRLTTLAAEGVVVAVATDHNHVNDYRSAAPESPAWTWLHGERGIEVTTWDPYWGHFNLYPLPKNFAPPAPVRQTPTQIFAWLRAQAPHAILQVNHPRMKPLIGYFDLTAFDPDGGRAGNNFSPNFDAIELANGMDLGRQADIDANVRDWFKLLNRGACYVATGSSDSHKVAYQWAGYPRTYVDVPRSTPMPDSDAFFAALRQGRAFVTSGPFVRVRLGKAELGDLVSASGELFVRAEIQATPLAPVSEIELVANGVVVFARKLNLVQGGKTTTMLPVTITRDTWLVVRLSGRAAPAYAGRLLPRTENASFAFTNPIFVDADGDDVFSPPEPPLDPALFPRCHRPHWPQPLAPREPDAGAFDAAPALD